MRLIFNRAAACSADVPVTVKQNRAKKISLAWMLVVPFILQVGAIASLVGYLSYRNSQQAIENLTGQLMDDVNRQVEQKLTSYLETPKLTNQIMSHAIVRGDIDLNLARSNARREQYLWQTMQQFDNLTWITLGSEAGDAIGTWRPAPGQPVQMSMSNPSTQHFGNYYAMNSQGQRTVRLKVEKPVYDPRTRPWYKEAIAAKRAIWNSIYAGFTPGTFFIAASQPLYDRAGKLVGVSGTDILLSNIQQFLQQNLVSASGQVFLMERQTGFLVSSSSAEAPFRTISDKKSERVKVLDSQTPLIRSTAHFLHQRFGNFSAIGQKQRFNFAIDSKHQFVQVLPYTQADGLDWLIVIVVPESDVMGQIHTGTQTTVWLCIGAVALTIGLNTWLSRWLVKPIRNLSQASQQITEGDFSHPVDDSEIRELSTLASSFNHMSQEIQQSRQQLEEYSRSLEQKVNDRTSELQQEIRHRTAAEAALQNANKQLQQLAYLDGLTQIANRRLFDERLQYEWQCLQREQAPLSLILCDVDYFKQYNDTYGHQAGDDCLRLVAEAIATATRRPADLAARYGGEEFVILLPNTDVSGAIEVAKIIQTNIAQLQIPHQGSPINSHITASFGVASIIPSLTSSIEMLLLEVDRALYQAKIEGRNQIFINSRLSD